MLLTGPLLQQLDEEFNKTFLVSRGEGMSLLLESWREGNNATQLEFEH